MFYINVITALCEEKVEYLLVGDLAVNLYGVMRATMDLDIIVSVEQENLQKVSSIMSRLGFAPRIPSATAEDLANTTLVRSWIETKNLKAFSYFHKKEPFKTVDILLVHPLDFNSAYNRRVITTFDGIELNLIAKKDLIFMKNAAGREQDIYDVKRLTEIKDEDEQEN